MRTSGSQRSGADGAPPSLDAAMQVILAATADRLHDRAAGDHVAGRLAWLLRWPRVAHVAVAAALRTQVERLWAVGWQPADLYQVARRQADELVAGLVAAAVAEATAQHPAATTHPRWLAQLRQLDVHDGWSGGSPYPAQWADRHGITTDALLTATVDALAVALRLPPLPTILPPPGETRPDAGGADVADGGDAATVDEKVLGRVRALLAKAESTTFPDEAEALSAKAQELMSRYAIEQALAQSAVPTGLRPPGSAPGSAASARRIWLDAPYLSAKTLLVAEVGSANHCRTISSEKLGFVTVLGADVDLDVVEVLTTSLLVQATRAMLATGSRTSRFGTSRTRSFRHSFLLAYATRIGERLRDTAGRTEAAAGSALVPLFAERSRAVDELAGTLFPGTVRRRSFSAGNSDGWGAGRSAADRAVLSAEHRARLP